jgi:hypothetical protein
MTRNRRLLGGAMVTTTGAAFAMGSAGLAHADASSSTPPIDTLYNSSASARTFANGGGDITGSAAKLVSSAVEYIPVTAADTVKEAALLPTGFKHTPSTDDR